jgi:general L-amino acid transport system substrate-binding protein
MLVPALLSRAEDLRLFMVIGETISCGAAPKAGFADTDPQGQISGVAVDLCRAIAVAVLGEKAKVEFHIYDSDDALDKARLRHDAIFFLTRDAINQQKQNIQAGPVVFVDPVALMVQQDSPLQQPSDLAGRTVCLMIASPAQVALEAYASDHALHFARLAFQEDVEMLDAYNAQRCEAAVGESTYLATMRATPGAKHLVSRLLPTPLALNPIVAATENGDKIWSEVVFRLVSDLISGAEDPTFGLRAGWRDSVLTSTGDYHAMIQRHLVDGLGLAPGLNQPWPKGALLAP